MDTAEEELPQMERTNQLEEEKPKEQQKVQTKVPTDALTIVSNDKKIDTPDLLFTEDASMFDDFEFDMGEIEEETVEDEEIFTILEDPATFKGGGLGDFRKWVMERVRYPQIAQENGIQGNVIVEFVIDETGQLGRIKVLQSPDPVLSDAVIAVLQKSPKWKPGTQRGKAVKMKFVVPVSFKLTK
jgi:protein TonB